MATVTIALLLLVAVVVSGVVARLLPVAIPRPLVQIALGAAIGLVSHLRVELDPVVFFVLFLPPLLFLDGWRIPTEDLYEDRATILGLALGLVVFTVLGAGILIHMMIPAMPLAVAFAVAAVVSPTDPIAVSTIAARVPIPRRMMHILEGESLLNDASGLVCLRFAVAAALTGTFSLVEAGRSFVWIALSGLATGFIVTWVTTRIRDWIAIKLGEESGSQILVSLLIPFGAYLAAEQIHGSGILAAVAAGVTMSAAASSGHGLAATRVRGAVVWDMVQFVANGIIFVLLGEQIPGIMTDAIDTVRASGGRSPWWLLLYVLAITAGLAILRFLWVWVTLRFTLLRADRLRMGVVRPHSRLTAAFSLAGVRGAVTLAGVLTLPLTMTDGSPFPARALAIFVAAGVIVLSLLGASVGLPVLLRDMELPSEPARQAEENEARVAAAQAAIAAVQRALRDHTAKGGAADASIAIASDIISSYEARITRQAKDANDAEVAHESFMIEQTLRIAALEGERAELFRRVRARSLGSETGRKLVRELDLLEARYRSG